MSFDTANIIQKTLEGAEVPVMPKVRTSDGHILDWDREAIVKQLIKETKLSEGFHKIPGMDEETARDVAKKVEKRIRMMGVSHLSGPLVREIVNIVLLEEYHQEWRNISTRVGTPVYDAHLIDIGNGFEVNENANLQDNAETSHKKKADKISKEQYLLLLPPHLADAHLNGDIHIHDLEYLGTRGFCQDWDLRYFFYYGLMPDGSGTKASVAGPAKKAEVAVLHAVKALGSAQTNFSVAGDEEILIRDDSYDVAATRLVRIGEFVDGIISGRETYPIESIDGEFLDITDLNIKAAAFNPGTLKIEYRTINRVIRHPARDPLYMITTESGRTVSVTGAHSLFIIDGGAIKPIEVSKLKEGDYLAIPKRLPVDDTDGVDADICLIRSLVKLPDELMRDIYLIGASNDISRNHQIRYDWKRRDRIPLSFIKENEISIDPDGISLGIARSGHTIPAAIKGSMLPMLSRLLGYFAAEGHITFDDERNVYSVVLSFGKDETKIIEDAKLCIKKLFGITASVQSPHPTEVQLSVNSKLVAILFKDIFGTGENSRNKRIPQIIFNTTGESRHEFLAGYYCDGTIHRREVSYKTTTKSLASGLLYLLLQEGIVGRQMRGEGSEHKIGDRMIKPSHYYRTTISGRNNIAHLSQSLPFSMDNFQHSSVGLTTTNPPVAIPINHAGIQSIVESTGPIRNMPEITNIENKKHMAPHRVKRLLEHIRRTVADLSESERERIEEIRRIADGDLGFDIVRSIQQIQPTTEYVYDLSIDGYENFIGGHGGVILHNSGGQGFYNFLTFMAPYFEDKSYEKIEQLIQMFIYEMTQMMVARGGQLVFSSVQLSPGVPKLWRDKPVVYQGRVWNGEQAPLRTYGEFEREVRLAFKAMINVMLRGDYWGKPFNFPKPEISIEPDFMEEDEEFNKSHPDLPTYDELYDLAFKLAAKYGSPYFDNQLPAYRGAGKGISCYQCLGKDELIPLVQNGEMKVKRIDELFDDTAKNGKDVDPNGVEFVELSGSTPTVNFDTIETSINEFKGVMRQRYQGKLLNIILESGRRIKVTSGHPVFVLKNGVFTKKQARELDMGDYIPVLKKNANDGLPTTTSIDVEKTLTDAGYFDEIIVNGGEVNIKHAKRSGLPKNIPITEGLIRFLGYYLAEGCSDHSGRRYTVRLSFGKHESELIEDAVRCIRRVGIEPKISEEKTAVNVVVNSKLLYLLIDALGCGHNASNKSVPDILFNVGRELVGHYLNCAFNGDGNIDIQTNNRGRYDIHANKLRLKMISKDAVQKLVWLAHRIGVQMNYYEQEQTVKHPQTGDAYNITSYTIQVTSQDQIKNFSKQTGYGQAAVADGKKRVGGSFTRIPIEETGLDHYNLKYSSQYRSSGYKRVNESLIVDSSHAPIVEKLINGDVHVLSVKKIEEVYYDDYVYDLVDVSHTHNFSNALGVITGNCCAYQFSSNEEDDEFEDKLYFRDGKHFSMGGWQVISLNCPRAAYKADHDDVRLFNELKRLMDISVELFKVKKKWMDIIIKNNRMPFVTQRPKDPITGKKGDVAVYIADLVYTIGVVGINEMVQHHLGKQLHESVEAQKLAVRALTEMELYARELIEKCGMNIVLARTPAEMTAQRFVVSDILHDEYNKYAEQVAKGNLKKAKEMMRETRDLPIYYTNGAHVFPGADISLIDRIGIEHVFFPIVDGGNILHIWMGEGAPDPAGLKSFAMKIAKNTQVGYFTFTKDMTVCMDDFHVASGLKDECPNCNSTNIEHLSRVTGYIQAVSGWNAAKKQELEDRKRYDI